MLDPLPPLDDDGDAPVDGVWIPLVPPSEFAEDEFDEEPFLPGIALAPDTELDSEAKTEVPAADIALPPAGDLDEGTDEPLPGFEPIVLDTVSLDDDGDGDGLALDSFLDSRSPTRLPRVASFGVDWRDADVTRQLLRVGHGVVAIGTECRHYDGNGDVLARCALPSGFVRAAIVRRTTWPHSVSNISPADAGFELLCVARGKLVVRAGDQWVELLDDEATAQLDAVGLVQRGDDVIIESRGGHWHSLEGGLVHSAFAGRRLHSLAGCSPWVGLGGEAGRTVLMALEGESVRPLFASPTSHTARLHGVGKTFVLESPGDGLWVCSLAEARAELIVGSSAFRGVCLGEVGSHPKLWTTVELEGALALVEIDVESRATAIVGTLPWPVNDDDAPSIYDMIWLPEANRLLVASDYGLVGLRRASEGELA